MKTERNGTSNLIIGIGQIGTAIQAVLKCDGHDPAKGKEAKGHYDTIHVCIPYSKDFISEVEKYKKLFTPKHVVVHSTVPVGTCSKVGATHSPVRGVHPFLEPGVRKFVKYFGGGSPSVMHDFQKKGITCVYTEKPETTELMKLVDTTAYGINILIEKEIKRLCDVNEVPFDMVYTHANMTYNEGYEKLGMPWFSKYVLKHMEGKVGGHCVGNNVDLFDSWLCDVFKEQNGKLH